MRRIDAPRAASLAVLMAAVLLGGTAQAQDANRVSRERELLRRAQTALREAQAQVSALQAEKAAELARVRQQCEADAGRGRDDLRAAQARLRNEQAERERVRGERDAQREQAAAQQQAHGERERALGQQLAQARRELAERTQANTSVSGLLERSIESLADAEAKNRALYALGLELVERYRNKSDTDMAFQAEPLFGWRAVEQENEAERLRDRLAEQRRAGALR